MAELKSTHIKEFMAEVFPEVEVTEPIKLPEDVVPLYKIWCAQKGVKP